MTFEVPIIDFSPYLNGSEADKLKVTKQVVKAFSEIGFIYLANHGIPLDQVEKSFALSKEFFQLSQDEKDELAWSSPESNRGYVSQGREKTSRETEKDEVDKLRAFPDLKESFEIGKEPSSTFQNNWPKDAKYRDHFMAFFRTCHELHLKLMNAIGLGFGLPDAYFDSFCDKMDHNLRLLHYPEVSKSILDRDEQSRTGAHTDYGSLTLLFQDGRGGLEVKNFDDEFVPAPPIPGTIVINAGDLLARWSNDKIKSTEHRVVSPPLDPEGEKYPARYSIPFFCNPNFDAMIECLEVCKSEENPAKYAPILSGDHLVERLATTYQ